MTKATEEAFTWQGLPVEAQERTGAVRGAALELADTIERLVPPGEERTNAIRRLKEAVMWANAGISMQTRRDGPVKSPTSLLPLSQP